MNKTMDYAKKVFHILSTAAAALAGIPNGVLTGRAAVYLTLVSTFISLVLHAITTLYPAIATDAQE